MNVKTNTKIINFGNIIKNIEVEKMIIKISGANITKKDNIEGLFKDIENLSRWSNTTIILDDVKFNIK